MAETVRQSASIHDMVSLTLVLDESGQQQPERPVCVGAATCLDYGNLESSLRTWHTEWSQDERFDGQPSFDHFVESGFHNNQIPLEIGMRFIDKLKVTPGFRVSLAYSQRVALPALSDSQLCLVLYARLLRDIFLRRGVSHFELLFENNNELDSKFKRLADEAMRFATMRAPRDWSPPAVTVRTVSKQESLTVGVIDFALKIVSEWVIAGKPRDRQSSSFRNYLALERRFSVIEDIDLNERISRTSR